MTEIDIVSSGSQANGYIVKSGDDALVLELGCKFSDYVKHLKEGELSKVGGGIASHR